MRNPQNDSADTLLPDLDQLLEMQPENMGDEALRAYLDRFKVLRKKDIRQVLKDESHGRPEYQGFVYVLSNPAMPGLLKIGSTVGRVENRARKLRTTGVPNPFKIESVFPVYMNPKKVEKRVHRVLELFRSGGDREFFRLSVEYAVAAIQSVLETAQSATT